MLIKSSFAIFLLSNVIGYGVAYADAYPSKPIALIVPYPPGGPNDVIARAVANELGKELKTSFVIENKAGAGGNIGTAIAARAQPDGYTLVLPGSALAINTLLFKNTNYRLSDFRGVGLVARGPVVAVAHQSTNFRSITEVISQARLNPGTLSFPSGGVGTSPHLAGALINKYANIQMTHVPYKGTGEFLSDLLAGRVQVAFLSPLIAKPHVDSGKLIPLATSGKKRLRGWDGLPTMVEEGLPEVVLEPWYAIIAPALTPDDVVVKINSALQKALKSKDLQQQLFALGLDTLSSSPEETDAVIKLEVDKWKGINFEH